MRAVGAEIAGFFFSVSILLCKVDVEKRALFFVSSAMPHMQRSHLFASVCPIPGTCCELRGSFWFVPKHRIDAATSRAHTHSHETTWNMKLAAQRRVCTHQTRIKLIFSLMRSPDAKYVASTAHSPCTTHVGMIRRDDGMVLRAQNGFFVHFIEIALK